MHHRPSPFPSRVTWESKPAFLFSSPPGHRSSDFVLLFKIQSCHRNTNRKNHQNIPDHRAIRSAGKIINEPARGRNQRKDPNVLLFGQPERRHLKHDAQNRKQTEDILIQKSPCNQQSRIDHNDSQNKVFCHKRASPSVVQPTRKEAP